MNSFGCSMCKLTEKVCSYEHLTYENTFKQDGRLLLVDILPFKVGFCLHILGDGEFSLTGFDLGYKAG